MTETVRAKRSSGSWLFQRVRLFERRALARALIAPHATATPIAWLRDMGGGPSFVVSEPSRVREDGWMPLYAIPSAIETQTHKEWCDLKRPEYTGECTCLISPDALDAARYRHLREDTSFDIKRYGKYYDAPAAIDSAIDEAMK